ncbi:MAG TPA: carboxypeptidase-like regulatory domain-containing protein [Chitinophagaceae bacterium]|nr:carboxypeptidase-like regulatory domain-containing protein [Chitinophagaceae bacterium]
MRTITKTLFLILAAVIPNLLWAQTTITGKVTDKKNPLPLVSIVLKDTYDGATTDSSGKYSFKTSEKGEYLLTATSVGYKPFEQKITLVGQGLLTIDIVLKEEITELSAVVISAGTFEASDRKRAAAVLDPIDIVTTASANGDVTGALKTLPGAQQVGETEGLFVRGGTAGETKIFIDGTLVNNFFQGGAPNIAGYGRFSPFLFKGTVFSTGGYSALYGQALSSALILESIDLPERTSASLGLSIIGVNGGYQALSKNKKFSWGGAYSYMNLAPAFAIIKQKQDYSRVPEIQNGDINFRIKTSAKGMIKYYAYFATNRFDFTVNSIDSPGYLDRFALKNLNMYHNLSWKESIGKMWKLNMGLSYTNNDDDIRSGMKDGNKNEVLLNGLEFKKFRLDLDANHFNGKLVFERRLKGLSAIRVGSEYNYSDQKSLFTIYNGQKFPERLKENIKSVFAESDIYITNALAAKIGTRFEQSSLLDKTNIAPRLSLAYKLSKRAQASVAYGIFYQNPERRYLPSPNELGFMKATHYVAQYMTVSSARTFRAEIFYKKYDDLIKTGFTNGRDGVAINNNGFGDAKGLEFFWRDKKTIRNVDYWISYSFLDTKRDFLNFPNAITPNFAAKHTASLVVKKFVQAWKMQFNGAYNYASGRPYYNISFDGTRYYFADRGTVQDYHNVSVAFNYLPSIGKPDSKNFAVYVLSISNAFGIKQVYGYQYSYNGLRKEQIVPPSRIFVYIGAFFSFGIDRSQDAVDRLF